MFVNGICLDSHTDMDDLKGRHHADLQARAQSDHGTIHGLIYVSVATFTSLEHRLTHGLFQCFGFSFADWCTITALRYRRTAKNRSI